MKNLLLAIFTIFAFKLVEASIIYPYFPSFNTYAHEGGQGAYSGTWHNTWELNHVHDINNNGLSEATATYNGTTEGEKVYLRGSFEAYHSESLNSYIEYYGNATFRVLENSYYKIEGEFSLGQNEHPQNIYMVVNVYDKDDGSILFHQFSFTNFGVNTSLAIGKSNPLLEQNELEGSNYGQFLAGKEYGIEYLYVFQNSEINEIGSAKGWVNFEISKNEFEAIPEPTSFALLFFGLFGLSSIRIKVKKFIKN